MKLKAYLEKNKIPATAFASSIGMTYNGLYKIMEQKQEPKLSTAIKIVKETEGIVKYEDLLIKQPPKTGNKDKKNPKK